MLLLLNSAKISCFRSSGIGKAGQWGCRHRAIDDTGIVAEGQVILARQYERQDLEHISWRLHVAVRILNKHHNQSRTGSFPYLD